MIIQYIDNKKLLMKKNIKSNAKIYNSIINRLFHIIHIFSNITMLISISKFVRVLASSNTFSNTYIRAMIGQLHCYKAMKFMITSMHVIYLHLKQSDIFLDSNCIIDHQQFNAYKFIFSMSTSSHSTII